MPRFSSEDWLREDPGQDHQYAEFDEWFDELMAATTSPVDDVQGCMNGGTKFCPPNRIQETP